jgi:PhnB protein
VIFVKKILIHKTIEKIMALINPHMNFNGNAEEAFNFYRSVFGGEFSTIMRFKDLSSPEFPIAENDANKIMHIELPIGKKLFNGQ